MQDTRVNGAPPNGGPLNDTQRSGVRIAAIVPLAAALACGVGQGVHAGGAEGGAGPIDAANLPTDDSRETRDPKPDADSGVTASSDAGSIACQSEWVQLTGDRSHKSDLVGFATSTESQFAWIDDVDAAQSVVFAAERDGLLSTFASGWDSSQSFDAHLLGVPSRSSVRLFISDATTVSAYDWIRGERLSSTALFDVDLPLLDARAFRTSSGAIIVGVDVAQGCGVFVRAAISALDVAAEYDAGVGEGDGGARRAVETAMSDCLVNFRGTLRAGTVLSTGDLALLVGDRLMRLDATTLEFDARTLRGSDYSVAARAALAWGDSGGLLVFPDGLGTKIELVQLDGSVSFGSTLDAEASNPVELLEAEAGRWWLTKVHGASSDSLQRIELDVFDGSTLEREASHVLYDAGNDIRNVQSSWLQPGRLLQTFWLAQVDGVRQVFSGKTQCVLDR